jgi:DNA (cytosine-5)-methyltransferase 1
VNVLSLFSGIGGLELGLERAGMTTVGQVERDPYCQRVLAKHWPEVPRHDDVQTAPTWWATPGAVRPDVDLVAGGPPCQGHSSAGKQLGTGDPRWGWPWFRGVVDSIEPPFVLLENVPNLLRTGLVDILRDLADRGFDAWWGRVPAAAVGAPHLRWRLFLIAAHTASVDGRARWTWRPPFGGDDREDLAPARVVNPWDFSAWTVAHAHGPERRRPSRDAASGEPGTGTALGVGPPKSGGRGQALADADADGFGLGAGLREGGAGGARSSGLQVTESGDGCRWPAEPRLDRVANGVPAGVDRLRALGNAVVPQVGEYIGHLIMTNASRVEVAA